MVEQLFAFRPVELCVGVVAPLDAVRVRGDIGWGGELPVQPGLHGVAVRGDLLGRDPAPRLAVVLADDRQVQPGRVDRDQLVVATARDRVVVGIAGVVRRPAPHADLVGCVAGHRAGAAA